MALACESNEGFEWMGVCDASSDKAFARCDTHADCGTGSRCIRGCYLTDPALCTSGVSGATDHLVATVCSSTGKETDCYGKQRGDPCGGGGGDDDEGGTCMTLCGKCQGPHVACHNEFPTCKSYECEKRSTPSMHYTKFPYSAEPSGTAYTYPLIGVNDKKSCEGDGTWGSPPQGWSPSGPPTWDEDTKRCMMTAPVDGGPGPGIVVPVQAGNVPLTQQSSECTEVGGTFDEKTVTCSMPPQPMVVHECVYGDIGHPEGTAALQNLGAPLSAAELTPNQYQVCYAP